MTAPSILPARGGNKLLASLSLRSDESHILRISLSRISLAAGAYLSDDIDRVLFIEKGIISQTIIAEDGRSLGISMIGSEGAVGLPGVGAGDYGFQARALTAVEALQISERALDLACAESRELERLLQSYLQSFLRNAICAMACHYYHNLDKRLSRWLLMIADRIGSNKFFITQEVLAEAHGVTQSAISHALEALELKGLIESARGQVAILNRRKLRSRACGCYLAIDGEEKYLVRTPVL